MEQHLYEYIACGTFRRRHFHTSGAATFVNYINLNIFGARMLPTPVLGERASNIWDAVYGRRMFFNVYFHFLMEPWMCAIDNEKYAVSRRKLLIFLAQIVLFYLT